MGEFVYMANGKKVPKSCVDALHEFETTWPGATFPGARPAIVAAVIKGLQEFEADNDYHKW